MAMTQGKHLVVPATQAAATSGPHLSAVLGEQWSAYRKARKRCRRAAMEEAVHRLRIEIRRTLATLDLLAPLLPDEARTRISEALRRELKMLSRLRDTHVHLEAIAQHLARFPGARALHETLRKREDRWTRKIRRELKRSGVGKLTREITQLLKILIRGQQAGNTEPALLARLQQAFDHVSDCQRKVNFKKIETIHRTRVAFKNYRYMVEAAHRIRPLISAHQREALRRVQVRMGGIQDADTLLARVEKYRCKKNGTSLAEYCTYLCKQRDILVRRFAAGRMNLQTLGPKQMKWKMR
jgi:CHAD domain-containing protein